MRLEYKGTIKLFNEIDRLTKKKNYEIKKKERLKERERERERRINGATY